MVSGLGNVQKLGALDFPLNTSLRWSGNQALNSKSYILDFMFFSTIHIKYTKWKFALYIIHILSLYDKLFSTKHTSFFHMYNNIHGKIKSTVKVWK